MPAKQYSFGAHLLGIMALLCFGCENDPAFIPSDAPPSFPAKDWVQVSNPEQHGWSLERLNSAKEFSEASGSDAVMIIEKGYLIDSWGNCSRKSYVASVRKSFLGLLYGYYTGDEISLDATLADYEIDDKSPTLNQEEKKATVRMLLRSSSGVYHKAAASDNVNIPARNSTRVGETFYYNNWDFNALGTIFEKRTQRSIFDVFHDSIASRIGMQDFDPRQDGRYVYSEVSVHPAYHFDMTARDMARLGLLVLNRGNWEGRQILPAAWIDTVTAAQIAVPHENGGGSYGYMWWVHTGGLLVDYAGIPVDAFSAQGNQSQLILIVPGRKLVIVHRARRNLDPARLMMILKMILTAKE